MTTACSEHVSTLRQHSEECIDNGAPVEVPAAMSPGDMLPQGDIGLLMLASLPPGCSSIAWPDGDMQLAPGTSKGSRHCVPAKYRDVVAFYRISDGDQLSDMVIEATGPFDLTHPEHADHLGYPAGTYRVRHQMNAQRERVID